MRISRRDLIKTGTLAGVAATVPLGALLGATDAEATAMRRVALSNASQSMDRNTFQLRLNDIFNISAGGQTIGLRLISVTDIPCAAAANTQGHQDCFVLVFQGAATLKLKQDTYSANNRVTGPFSVFLVPGGADARSSKFTATFNRVTA
jgi:hypothetical protein